MLEATTFWRALTRFINCSILAPTLSSMKQFGMQSGCHRTHCDFQGLIGPGRFKHDAHRGDLDGTGITTARRERRIEGRERGPFDSGWPLPRQRDVGLPEPA